MSSIVDPVLLVEDVAAMRLYLKLALESRGVEVLDAADLREARDKIESAQRLGGVLLDLELPDGHGLDLMRDLPASTPVLALTADVSKEVRLRCEQAGCAGVIAKGEGVETVLKVLGEYQGRGQDSSPAGHPDSALLKQYKAYLVEARIEIDRARARKEYETVQIGRAHV